MKEEKDYGGHPLFKPVCEELVNLHGKKNHQYATKENPLDNFEEGAQFCKHLMSKDAKNKKLTYLLTLMAKQSLAVNKIVGSGQTDTLESVEDKLRDIAIYSIIGIIMCREKKI